VRRVKRHFADREGSAGRSFSHCRHGRSCSSARS
jgi:hypothetical protein